MNENDLNGVSPVDRVVRRVKAERASDMAMHNQVLVDHITKIVGDYDGKKFEAGYEGLGNEPYQRKSDMPAELLLGHASKLVYGNRAPVLYDASPAETYNGGTLQDVVND